MGWGRGLREVQEGGDVCILMADSHCMAETHVQGAAAAQLQGGREELLHVQGQEGKSWGDIPCPR